MDVECARSNWRRRRPGHSHGVEELGDAALSLEGERRDHRQRVEVVVREEGDLGRALILFDDASMPGAATAFRAATGGSLRDWLDVSLLLYGACVRRPTRVVDPRDVMPPWISRNAVAGILELLSATPSQIATYYDAVRGRSPLHGLYAPSIFAERPAYRQGDGRLLVLHENLLIGRATYGIPAVLGDIAGAVFREEFGPILERYVGRVLRQFGAPVVGARELEALGEGDKTTDFVLAETTAVLTIEVKAVEYRNTYSTAEAL